MTLTDLQFVAQLQHVLKKFMTYQNFHLTVRSAVGFMAEASGEVTEMEKNKKEAPAACCEAATAECSDVFVVKRLQTLIKIKITS